MDIALATLNARYIHTAFGLRYLHENLGELRDRCQLFEFTIGASPLEIAETLLAGDPKIIGLGVYIWNTEQTLKVARLLKTLRPAVHLVVGGPEVSYEWQDQPLCELADHIVVGEGELAFAGLCNALLDGASPPKLLAGSQPDTKTLAMPYAAYTDADIANRVLYVEASRGCPYRCSFCLSSLDKAVRTFPLEAFLAEMQTLIDRGAKQFKFVDRTFNLSIRTTEAILRFFLARMDQGLFVHFEMVPDRFPAQLRDLIAAFPPGAVQLEVGVQTLNPEVAARIERRQDNAKVLDNLTFLSSETGVHLHADLIVGLPGEDLASFARGFDLLLTTGVQEIQVGILKRLRGAPVNRLTHAHEMVYSPLPPYELLRNQVLSESEMAAMRRFARYWDVIANSGRFTQTLPLILAGESGFAAFSQLAGWLFARFQATHAVSLKRWVVALFGYLTDERGADPAAVAMALAADYRRVSRKEHVPAVLRPHLPKSERTIQQDTSHLPARQRRHVG